MRCNPPCSIQTVRCPVPLPRCSQPCICSFFHSSFPPARPKKVSPKTKIPPASPSMAAEQMEEAAAATPFQLQFDKPIPFQVSSRLCSYSHLSLNPSECCCGRVLVSTLNQSSQSLCLRHYLVRDLFDPMKGLPRERTWVNRADTVQGSPSPACVPTVC